MNKKLLSVAVAAAMVTPVAAMADTTLYGDVNNMIVHTDDGATDTWDIEDNSSKLGVKVSEDLGNGMTAIAQIELSVETADDALDSTDGDSEDRLGFVGLTGGFGTFIMGRISSPYQASVNKTDIMFHGGGELDQDGQDRYGEIMSYVTPNFGGFSATIAAIVSNNSLTAPTWEDGIDAEVITLDYNNGPLSVGLGITNYEGTVNENYWGIAASYNFGNFTIIGEYQDGEDVGSDQMWGLAFKAGFGNNTVYGQYNEEDSSNDDYFGIGLSHAFSKRTNAYVEYATLDTGTDTNTFTIGLKHEF